MSSLESRVLFCTRISSIISGITDNINYKNNERFYNKTSNNREKRGSDCWPLFSSYCRSPHYRKWRYAIDSAAAISNIEEKKNEDNNAKITGSIDNEIFAIISKLF